MQYQYLGMISAARQENAYAPDTVQAKTVLCVTLTRVAPKQERPERSEH